MTMLSLGQVGSLRVFARTLGAVPTTTARVSSSVGTVRPAFVEVGLVVGLPLGRSALFVRTTIGATVPPRWVRTAGGAGGTGTAPDDHS